MITIRELTRKCSIHNTPLASKPVDGSKGQMIGRSYWCPLCDNRKHTAPVRFTHGLEMGAQGKAQEMTREELDRLARRCTGRGLA